MSTSIFCGHFLHDSVKQKFNNKHFFTSLVAMEKTLTGVPIVDVETAEKEISQDERFTSSFSYFATRTCTVYSCCI